MIDMAFVFSPNEKDIKNNFPLNQFSQNNVKKYQQNIIINNEIILKYICSSGSFFGDFDKFIT